MLTSRCSHSASSHWTTIFTIHPPSDLFEPWQHLISFERVWTERLSLSDRSLGKGFNRACVAELQLAPVISLSFRYRGIWRVTYYINKIVSFAKIKIQFKWLVVGRLMWRVNPQTTWCRLAPFHIYFVCRQAYYIQQSMRICRWNVENVLSCWIPKIRNSLSTNIWYWKHRAIEEAVEPGPNQRSKAREVSKFDFFFTEFGIKVFVDIDSKEKRASARQ